MSSYRVLITGSRSWDDYAKLSYELGLAVGAAPSLDDVVVVHGDCPSGADALAAGICRQYGYRQEPHPADWQHLGKGAGFHRNAEMVSLGAGVCLAFIRNASRGATHCADLAEKAGIPVRRFEA